MIEVETITKLLLCARPHADCFLGVIPLDTIPIPQRRLRLREGEPLAQSCTETHGVALQLQPQHTGHTSGGVSFICFI